MALFGFSEFSALPLLRMALRRSGGAGLTALRFGQQGWYFDLSLQTICFGALRPLMEAGFQLEKGLLE
jgi:hypothetical protein